MFVVIERERDLVEALVVCFEMFVKVNVCHQQGEHVVLPSFAVMMHPIFLMTSTFEHPLTVAIIIITEIIKVFMLFRENSIVFGMATTNEAQLFMFNNVIPFVEQNDAPNEVRQNQRCAIAWKMNKRVKSNVFAMTCWN